MEPATLNLQERPRMLVDAYIAVRVVKEGLRRISGVPTGTSVLTTMFGIGVLVTAIHRIAAPALRAFRPKHPSVAGTAIGLAPLIVLAGLAPATPLCIFAKSSSVFPFDIAFRKSPALTSA